MTDPSIPPDSGLVMLPAAVVPVTRQTAYVDAARALGGTVETRDYPSDDHFSLPQSCVADARRWLTEQLPRD